MLEIIIIIILLMMNGLLAMSEIAFVSSRRFKLEESARKGNPSAKKALKLLSEPEKFLSAVQIGITLVGILAGAFGGYAMAEDLTPYISKIDMLRPYAVEISFALIVAIITYLSLVIGELVPKSIALNNPEKITLLMAGLMHSITKMFAPFVWFLSLSTKFIMFLLPIKKSEESPISEDELKALLEAGRLHGTFENEEAEMIKKIFSLNDKRVSDIMIPRTEIEWIDTSLPNEEIFQYISSHNYSRYVACDKSIDNFMGIIDSKEFLLKYNLDPSFDFKSIINEPLVVPHSIYSIDLFEKFRANKTNITLVVDEYGGTEGLVTLHDLIEKIFGELPDKYEDSVKNILMREDGTFLIDGSADFNEIAAYFSFDHPPAAYSTAGGFMMAKLGRIPKEGEIVNYKNYRFEVIDMDGMRVDKILVRKL